MYPELQVQLLLDGGDQLLAGHCKHSIELPVIASELYFPALHISQPLEPWPGILPYPPPGDPYPVIQRQSSMLSLAGAEKVSAGQGKQVSDPFTALKVPAGHC